MLELLKRFEQDSLDDPSAQSDEDEGPVDDLERRLAGINLVLLRIRYGPP